MKNRYDVVWTSRVTKQLEKLPPHILNKFYAWVTSVKLAGIRETRKHPGFHDEPLHGDRRGQRSIRLNQSYRAIYIEKTEGFYEFIEVIKVSKHDYS